MNPITHEIPQDGWIAYFNTIVGMYQGARVSIEVLSPELGDQHLADRLLLHGLSFETKGSEAGDILIEVGDIWDYMVHHVDRPRSVRFVQFSPGADGYLQIESEDGIVTLVAFTFPLALPPGHSEPPAQRTIAMKEPRVDGRAPAAPQRGNVRGSAT